MRTAKMSWLVLSIVSIFPSLVFPSDKFLEQGKRARDAGMIDEALEWFGKAVKDNPDDADARYHRAEMLRFRATPEALEELAQATRLRAHFPQAYLLRGEIHFVSKTFKVALVDLNTAISQDPKLARAYGIRGLCFQCLEQYARAIGDFDKAITLSPKHPGAYANLAWLMAVCPEGKYRDGEKAVKYANKALDLLKRDLYAFRRIAAAAYAEKGDFKSAISEQAAALKGFDRDFAGMGPRSAELRKIYEKELENYEHGKPLRYKTIFND